MPSVSTFWLFWFPYLLGLLTIVVTATLFIRWNLQHLVVVPRRSAIPLTLKLKAFAPLAVAVLLFSAEHDVWRLSLPWLVVMLGRPPYDDEMSHTVARCILHVFFAVVTYLVSDHVCHRLLRSPFPRSSVQAGPIGAELNQWVSASQGLPPNEQIGE